MTAIAENLLPALVRTTLWLSLAVLVVEVWSCPPEMPVYVGLMIFP